MMLQAQVLRNLRRLGITPSRDLGQNFLVNPSIASEIAAAVPREGSTLEIGPGLGALTGKLLPRCSSLTVVELSAPMAEFLTHRFSGTSLKVIRDDFLGVDPGELPGSPFSNLVGNLPYSISSPILFRLLEDGFRSVGTAVLMLQREVALRLSALDGGKDYGKLSLQLWPVFTVGDLLDAEPEDFFPSPEVRSRVVIMKRRREPLARGSTFSAFRGLVKVSFAMRRKTILNNLKAMMGRESALELLRAVDIDPGLRAEQISPEKFLRMAEALS